MQASGPDRRAHARVTKLEEEEKCCASNPTFNSRTLEDVLKELNRSLADYAEKPATTASDKGAFGDYPLHKIAIWGDVDAARILIAHGTNVNVRGEDDDTPLHRAIAGGHAAMVQLLISRGADPSIKNRYGNSSWDDAKSANDPALLTALHSAPSH